MTWELQVKAFIDVCYQDKETGRPVTVMEGGNIGAIMKGTDPEELLEKFCMIHVVPSAQNGADTQRKVNNCLNSKDWKGMLEPYLSNQGDCFWGADAVRIVNTETGDVYYDSGSNFMDEYDWDGNKTPRKPFDPVYTGWSIETHVVIESRCPYCRHMIVSTVPHSCMDHVGEGYVRKRRMAKESLEKGSSD